MSRPNFSAIVLSTFALLLTLLSPRIARGECPAFTLRGSDILNGDHAGVAVAVSGNVAILGANLNDTAGTNAGAAWIFRWNGSSWVQEQKLQGSDTAAYDEFGMSVAIDGNVAVVVAPGKSINNVASGATYLFRYNGSSWVQEQRLSVGTNGIPYTSWASASISGDTIVVGNSKDATRGSYAGAAYVYRYHPERAAGDRWTLESLKRNNILEPRLTASDAAGVDYFGLSVAASGNTIVVGSYGDDDRGSLSGAAYLFERNTNNTADSNDDFWEQKQKLVPTDGVAYDQFGFSVALDANTIVVGAVGDSSNGAAFGSAYAFIRSGSNWVQQAELFGSVSSANGFFGNSVAVSGDSILVGAPYETPFWTKGGSAHLYRKTGSSWNEHERIRLEDPNAYGNNNFGYSVAVSNDKALVGAMNALGTGTASIFDLDCGSVPLVISASSPANGYIDPFEDRSASNQSTRYGIQNVSITFSAPVTSSGGSAITPSNFQISCLRNNVDVVDLQTGAEPVVTQVTGSGVGPYQLQLSQRICLGAWTEIKAVNVFGPGNVQIQGPGDKIVLGFLPMDITQDGQVLGDDINRWLAINNGGFTPLAPLTSLMLLDQRRNGVIAGEDITRGIQLINGIGTFRAWSGFDLGPKP